MAKGSSLAPALDESSISIISRETVYKGYCSVEAVRVAQVRSDGKAQTLHREVVRYGANVVAILPIDRERRKIMLCRQLRVPMMIDQDDPFPWEVCAGRLEEGENALDGAWRELKEELGVVPTSLFQVLSSYSSPGILGARADLLVAEYSLADRETEGGGLEEEGEDITVLEMDCSAVAELYRTGELRDAKTILLVQYMMLKEPALFA